MRARKQIVLLKMKGLNSLLEKYDMKPHDERTVLSKVEGLDSSDLESRARGLRI